MYLIFKRIFDLIASVAVLIGLLPLLLIIAAIVLVSSPGGIFYRQTRVGKNGKEFELLKFRSMRQGSDVKGQLTIGNDHRVTKIGKFIRKFKLDEFPQLINIIRGQMSIVGPRPEVPKYVALYNEEQKKVLEVLPGLTDMATIEYINEQEILGNSENPEETYLNEVMPAKLALNLQYVKKANFWFDIYLIFKTIGRIFLP